MVVTTRGVTVGDLRHRVTLERKSRGASDDAGGYVSETWAPVATVWAKLDPKSGRESVDADQVVHRVSHVVTMRARDGVTAAMRLRFGSRILAILEMREIHERGRWLELVCEETAPS